jgi:SPIRAL1-like protein
MHDASASAAVRDLVRPLLLQDLRIQCRARGLNPGGGRDTLADRLVEHMLATGDR